MMMRVCGLYTLKQARYNAAVMTNNAKDNKGIKGTIQTERINWAHLVNVGRQPSAARGISSCIKQSVRHRLITSSSVPRYVNCVIPLHHVLALIGSYPAGDKKIFESFITNGERQTRRRRIKASQC